jgi:NADH-quinone oxidoreductase subunit L
MFLACGVGAFTAGMFHVTTHAFFKACLFLGSGSVIHALAGEQDIRRMGGLASKIPTTYRTFLIATLDDRGRAVPGGVLLQGRDQGRRLPAQFAAVPWLAEGALRVALFTAGLTAFYMFRCCADVLGTLPRRHEAEKHIHESPATMTIPLIVLAFLSVVSGTWAVPDPRGGNKIGEFSEPTPAGDRGAARGRAPRTALRRARADGRGRGGRGVGIYLAWSWYAKGEGRVPDALAQGGRACTGASRTSTSWTRPTTGLRQGLAIGGGDLLWEVDATVVDLIPNGAAAVTKGSPGSRRSSISTSSTEWSTAWRTASRRSAASSGRRRPGACRTTRW